MEMNIDDVKKLVGELYLQVLALNKQVEALREELAAQKGEKKGKS